MVLLKPNESYAFYRIPGLVATTKGSLLAYCECRSELSDWAKIDIKVYRSIDGGESWENTHTVCGCGNTLNNPVMIVDGENIHFIYCKNYRQIYYAKSTDDGLSFSTARSISSVLNDWGEFYNAVAVGPGHAVEVNGKLIAPIWFSQNTTNKFAHKPSKIATIYSLDKGENWRLGEIIDSDFPNSSESSLAVMPSGKIALAIRHEDKERKVAVAFSDNGINGWSKPRLTNIADPICQGSLLHYNDAVYHINCSHPTERKNLTVKMVNEDFVAVDEITIDELGGYADMAIIDDTLYILYERDVFNSGEIHFTKMKTL